MTIGCRTTCLREDVVPTCCEGFFGDRCEPCPGPSGRPCHGNGVCVDGTNGTGVCRCNKGFNGTACETCEGGKYGVHCDQGRFSTRLHPQTPPPFTPLSVDRVRLPQRPLQRGRRRRRELRVRRRLERSPLHRRYLLSRVPAGGANPATLSTRLFQRSRPGTSCVAPSGVTPAPSECVSCSGAACRRVCELQLTPASASCPQLHHRSLGVPLPLRRRIHRKRNLLPR